MIHASQSILTQQFRYDVEAVDSIGFEYFAVVAHIQYPWAQLVDHHHNHNRHYPHPWVLQVQLVKEEIA